MLTLDSKIPGIAVFGPSIDPQILGEITLTSRLDFGYGFDVSVRGSPNPSPNLDGLIEVIPGP